MYWQDAICEGPVKMMCFADWGGIVSRRAIIAEVIWKHSSVDDTFCTTIDLYFYKISMTFPGS